MPERPQTDLPRTEPIRKKRSPLLYFLVLICVNFMWAFQFSGAKIATARLGPIMVAFLPLAISTVLFLPMLFFERRRAALHPQPERGSRRTIVRDFILVGSFGIVFAQLGLTSGVNLSLASNASVLTLTIPVLTALMAVVLLGEKMTWLRWVSFAMAIAGVLMVSDIDWHSVQIFRGRYLTGNLLIFASCLGSAFYNSFSKKLLETFGPAEVLVYSFCVADAVLLILIFLIEPESWARLPLLGPAAWLSLGMIALFSLSISMVLFFWVIQRIEVTQASLSIYLLPVFGVLISSLALHEKITWQLVSGGLLVFVSTFLVTSYEERRKMLSNA